MIVTRALSPACVKVPLEGTDKNSILTEMVDLLDDHRLLLDRDRTLAEVFAREHTRSTGVGFGLAIPHGRSTTIRDTVMAVGTTPTPVDFDSVDGRPVSIVVLLLSPVRQTGRHIQALARVSCILLDPDFRDAVEKASSGPAVYELFVAADKPGLETAQSQVAAIA